MSEVRNCRKCGKIFTYFSGAPICQACRQSEEEDFRKVKEYLYVNPGSSLTQVATDLDMSVEKIKRFLKEGRLEITTENGNMILECEVCGRSIKSGRYCSECEKNLASGFKSAADRMKDDISKYSDSYGKGVGMRYLNKQDGRKD